MICLALSTSESIASAALSWGENEDQISFDKKKSPAGETLIQKIRELLEKHNLDRSKIERIGVNVGPGSFTGVRVGVTTANALGLGLRVPVLGFSSLDLIAFEWIFKNKKQDAEMASAVDAGRKQVFAAFYSIQNGLFKKTRPDALWDMTDFAKETRDLPLAGWKLESGGIPFEALCPGAWACLQMLKKTSAIPLPSFASPNYVRATDAENNLLRSKNH